MAQRDKSRFWRRCRIVLRRFRITLLSLILVLLGALIYLNQVGLPGFIKRPLQDKLRSQGLDLQFTRLRWRWAQGIVAENVELRRPDEVSSPQFTAKQARVQLDYKALARLQLRVSGFVLRQGQFSWDVTATNGPTRKISINNIQAELNLLPGDLWDLARFDAEFAGANFQLSGVVTNASAVPEWRFFKARRPSAPDAAQRRLRQLADLLEEIQFSTPPRLRVNIQGDARDLRSFAVRMRVNTPDARTPWGTIEDGRLTCLLQPNASNDLSRAEINLQADSAWTQWANTTNLALTIQLSSTDFDTNIVHADLDLTATNIETKWGQASAPHITAQWLHSITNPVPLSGEFSLDASEPTAPWGRAKELHLIGKLLLSTNTPPPTNETWAAWSKLAPYPLDWDCQLTGVESPKLEVTELSCSGEWRAPMLTLTKIASTLYDGRLSAQGDLNVATRQFQFKASSTFDAQRISPLLTEKSQQWLSQFSWVDPPTVQAEGSVILPAWTNRHPDWHAEVRPTVSLAGDFRIGRGSYRGAPFSFASSHFAYSNLFWRLPDLVAVRPEGRLNLLLEANDETRDYYFRVHSAVDPRTIRPLLEPNQQRWLDLFRFSQPPVIDGELWGRWYEHERIGGKATLSATNFEFRGQSVGLLNAALEYTNQFLLCLNPHAERGAEYADATGLGIDIPARKIYLTNGVGKVDPMVVARMIGTNVTRIMEPYHFLEPPLARVTGTIPMQDSHDANMHFEVEGGLFQWWRFKVPAITGTIDWAGEHLRLESIRSQFYRGSAIGNADFNFHEELGTDFRFELAASGADFHWLMMDLLGKTNRLEGFLNARINITQGNSDDWQNNLWGSGHIELADGLIWEIPVFGILSPALESIGPGLGSSRASEASATFVITNGIIVSHDLEVKASMMRLQYWGTVDLRNRVDARVQAELLHDTPLVGPVLSLALWPVSKLFEYQISGTLQEPKSEPVFFVPKIVLMPFHPVRTIKGVVPDELGLSGTNGPVRTP